MLASRNAALWAVVIVLNLARAATAGDDLMLRQRITTGLDSPAREQLQYYSPSVRITDDDRARSIIDLDAKKVVTIDKVKKTYLIMTFDEMAKRRDTHDDRVRDLPPFLRDSMAVREKVDATPTGRTMRIAGHPAKEYAVQSNKVSGKVWLAEDLSVKARQADWDAVAILLGGTSTPGGQLDQTLAKIGGLRMRSEVRIDPLPLVTTEVLEVREEVAPKSLREIPDGYTRVEPRPTRTQGPATPTPAPRAPRTPKPRKTPTR